MTLLFNASSIVGSYRKETLENIEYLVVPMVMLVEGVFTANAGPLYYDQESAADSAPAWNMKPIVCYHPTDAEGNFISAANPTVLEESKVGFILNANHDGRLVAEAWIDHVKAKQVDPRIVTAILNGKPMELSTGMLADVLMEEGEWNGQPYVGRARNFRPDHLALLPDKKGACGLRDGAGLLVMEFGRDPLLEKTIKDRLDSMIANQLSHDNLREALRRQLKAMLILDGREEYCWIAEVYQSYFIAEVAGKLWKISFTTSGDEVEVDTSVKPVEVVRVTEYRTVDGIFVGNVSSSTGETEVTKDEMIGKLIANGGYEDSDKAMLVTFSEEKLAKLVANIKGDEVPATTTPAKEAPPAQQGTLVANAKADWETFMASAPPQFRTVINRGVALMNQQIAADITSILEGSDGLYTEAELRAMDPDQLRKTATLVANMKKASEVKPADDVQLPAYFGGAAGYHPTMVANAGAASDSPLELPSTFSAN